MEAYIEGNSTVSALKRISLQWEMPVLFSIFYIVWVIRTNKTIRGKKKQQLKKEANRKNKLSGTAPKSRSFLLRNIMFLHNTGMSLFSITVFLNTFSIIRNGYFSMSFHEFILDADKKMWRQIYPWIWLFYISKYYEVVDTWILFASEKESSFLQMYHHAGAIIACWLVSLAETYSGWIWVVLNSFIHSIMYAYYAMTVFGIRPPFKRAVTILQIGQFISGFIFGFIYIFYPGVFTRGSPVIFYQCSAIIFNIVYVSILTYLFFRFERETYRKRKADAAKIEVPVAIPDALPHPQPASTQAPISASS